MLSMDTNVMMDLEFDIGWNVEKDDLDCDQEQLEYQYRLMTPREKDISRIDDRIDEIIQDTRSYTILGLETLLFTHSSSHIWSS